MEEKWQAHDKKVAPYHFQNKLIAWTSKIASLSFFLWFLFSHRWTYLSQSLQNYTGSPLLSWLLFFGVVGLLFKIVGFPFSVCHQMVEKNFGLSHQSWKSFFLDDLKGTVLGMVLGSVVLTVLFFIVHHFENGLWWLYTALFFLLFTVVLAQLAPVLLIPLFYKLEPMKETPLKQALLDLCKTKNVHVQEVYHLGMGAKTQKGNAAFVGLGKTKRIMLGDTLYEKFEQQEVEAVFAHELGHQVHNDLWKGILFSSLFLLLSFYLTDGVAKTWVLPYFDYQLASAEGFMMALVTLSVIQIPAGWLQAAFSRSREWAADGFADKEFGLAEPLADALEKLTVQNYGKYRPSCLSEFLTHSHPAPYKRILKLRRKLSTSS